MSTTTTVANKKRLDDARIGKNNTSRTSGDGRPLRAEDQWEPGSLGLFTLPSPPARVSLGANQLGSDAAADSPLNDRLIARRLWVILYQAEHQSLQHSHCHRLRCDNRISH